MPSSLVGNGFWQGMKSLFPMGMSKDFSIWWSTVRWEFTRQMTREETSKLLHLEWGLHLGKWLF